MKRIFAVLFIIAAVGASYAPALRDGFVWDDTALILRDPLIRSWRLIPEGFNHFLFTDATASDFYRPIQRLVYTANYCAFGFKPAPYHLTNILWHAAAAVALFFLAEELLLLFDVEARRRRWLAFFATLAWAIHPVHSAAVIYVSGLADPLAATFGFLGCLSILRSLRANGLTVLWLALAVIAFALSALSKESGLIFIPLAIVILALLRKWNALWKTAVVALFVCAIYFSLRNAAEHNPAPAPRAPQALSVRPITMARAFAEYAGLIIFPINLHMDRQVDAAPAATGREPDLNPAAWRELQTLLGVVLIAAAIFWAVRARTRNRLVFTLLVLAGMSYLPVSGIWRLNAAVAEHWIYVPTAFLLLAAAVAIVDLLQREGRPRWAKMTMSILAAAWCVFLGGRTFIRTFDWKDQRTFVERTIANGGDSARMWINLGLLELSEGHADLAKKHLQTALQKEPDQPLAVLNLGTVALTQNDFKTARELFMRATQMPMVDARAHELLVVLESKEHGRADVMRMRLATRTGPPDWSIERRYVKLLDETGSTSAAINEIRHCLTTEWYRAESWKFLGLLLIKAGHAQEAAQALAQAKDYDVHLDPNAP